MGQPIELSWPFNGILVEIRSTAGSTPVAALLKELEKGKHVEDLTSNMIVVRDSTRGPK